MKDCGDMNFTSMAQAGEILTFTLIKRGYFLTRPSSSPLQDALGRAAATSIQSLYGTTFTVGSICTTICEYFASPSFYGQSQDNSLCPPDEVSPSWKRGCFCRADATGRTSELSVRIKTCPSQIQTVGQQNSNQSSVHPSGSSPLLLQTKPAAAALTGATITASNTLSPSSCETRVATASSCQPAKLSQPLRRRGWV